MTFWSFLDMRKASRKAPASTSGSIRSTPRSGAHSSEVSERMMTVPREPVPTCIVRTATRYPSVASERSVATQLHHQAAQRRGAPCAEPVDAW